MASKPAGVRPSRSIAWVSARRSKRSSTTRSAPDGERPARCNGCSPFLVAAFMAARARKRNSTAPLCPCPAARCRGCDPSAALHDTTKFAPPLADRRRSSTAAWPERAARCDASSLPLATARTEARSSSSRSITDTCPRLAARCIGWAREPGAATFGSVRRATSHATTSA